MPEQCWFKRTPKHAWEKGVCHAIVANESFIVGIVCPENSGEVIEVPIEEFWLSEDSPV